MRLAAVTVAGILLSGCGSTWTVNDEDGDGYSIVEGDCFDGPGGSGIGPGEPEVWYNGTDENCDGNDGDHDGDGVLAVEVGGEDCFDNPDDVPADFLVLNGFVQPLAAEVHPGAAETFYDGIDQDCAGDDDFDQDLDGYASMAWAEVRTGLPVTDCYDAVAEAYPELWAECVATTERVVDTPLAPSQVYPGAADLAYDGTDANCDGLTDFDDDGDGFDRCEECDDADAEIFPNDAEEIWYNGIDENCDSNDADRDDDGYVVEGYAEPADPIHFGRGTGDCWDDPSDRPASMEAINGFPDPDSADVNPGAIEVWYDAVDQDCAGDDDFDQDADGDPTDDYYSRDGLLGYDCDDEDGTISSLAADSWYDGIDSNCDGESDYDQDGDGHDAEGYGVAGADDCDDSKFEVNPDVNENCGTTYDDDCDSNTNDDDAESCVLYYDDADADSYGDINDSRCLCTDEGSYTELGTVAANADCDDTKAAVNPGVANESCSTSYDDDCNGVTNEQNGTACTTYYLDADGDTYGTTTSQCWCSGSGDYDVTNDDDCDDSKAAVNPGVANELCTTTYDDDCDGSTNERNGTGCTTYYYDSDSDGFGTTTSQCWCSVSGSYTSSASTDCDDADDNTFPGAASSDSTTSCMTDADGDNYGDSSAASPVTAGTDCDDSRSGVKPGGTETCGTTYDDDCDGSTNDVSAVGCTTYYYDADNDGYGLSSSSQCTCTTSGSYDVTNSTDCDDGDADTFPGAASNDSATSCMNDDDGDNYGDETVSSGVTAGTDCDDSRSAVSPAGTETCSTTYDDDCDDSTNDIGATGCTTYYYDADNDGYGLSTSSLCRCTTSGYYDVTNSTDCDDGDADTFPGAASNDSATSCMNDDDADNYGDVTVSGTVVAGTDCDDTRSAVRPGATESCSTTYDDDCDGNTNDVGATSCTTYYYDGDNDGYGLSTSSQCTCTTSGSYDVTTSTDCDDAEADTFPGAASNDSSTSCMNDDDGDNYGDVTVSGSVVAGTDCDDTLSAVRPGATETCSTTYDDDCDGGANDTGATGCTTYYYDGDNDGYGLSTSSQCTCTTSGSYDVTNSTDCDDADDDTFPGAAGSESSTSCMNDDDDDGYGDVTVSGTVTAGTDCDDTLSAVKPGATETCSTTYDDDCDGNTNDTGATGCTTYYYDGDNDGYGLSTASQCTCSGTGSYDVTNSTDCDDGDDDLNPGEADTLATNDGIDNDCDGYIDESGVTAGSVVLTEYMSAGLYTADWFEIYNATAYDVALDNWTITLCHDDATAIASGDAALIGCESEVVLTVEAGHTVASGDYFVFCAASSNFSSALVCPSGSTSSIGDRFTDYDAPAYAASNDLEADNGGITVELGATMIDEVWWWQTTGNDDWPSSTTSSVQLDLSTSLLSTAADDNDDYTTDTASPYSNHDIWCLSTDAGVTDEYSASSTEYGTPGSVNVECP